jgi:hypothetical protein
MEWKVKTLYQGWALAREQKTCRGCWRGAPYTTFPPMMTSSSFDFRVYLKNIFALEPLLKLATFVVEEVVYQNVKKKVQNYPPPL